MKSDRKPSLAVVYFGVGFTLAAALTMVLLTVLRPMMAESETLRMGAMLAPVIIGGGYGARVAFIGLRRDLRLGPALVRALVPWETGR